ncbi:THAP domain-containing protein 11-like [Denticeps clupeoides]|uniref:THAP domain-containing protein 11 n=1 Tax=Denticeps clupeoides TaxID=299321 RepID=A0AAY4BZ54_9TELE|nr:THAP domain-containing protein 11-like [Denticeps clupeoides]
MPGFTCCVPGCYSNSHRDRELRFYTFPKDPAQRDLWLRNVSRAGVSGCFSAFQPTTGHRVCSAHFSGGRKTYNVRVPTVFPLRGVNERANRRGKPRKARAAADGAGPSGAGVGVAARRAPDHSYSLTTGTTCAELRKKLNEQRDILALMETKMKEMKGTIRALRGTEARLQDELRERDRLLTPGCPP